MKTQTQSGEIFYSASVWKAIRSALARQVYGLEYAMDAAWYWHGDVGPRDQPHKMYDETDDFGL